MTRCWNTIGVFGDGSCPELPSHIHCRECPVYAGAAHSLLDRPVSGDYEAERSRHFSQPKAPVEADVRSVLLFRVSHEWFGVSARVVSEIADVRPVHALPHRRSSAVLGVTNIRGELLVCVSLDGLLQLEGAAQPAVTSGVAARRLLVLRRGDTSAVAPVDEVEGVLRFTAQDCRPVPATLAKSASPLSTSVVRWKTTTVGVLEDQALFGALQRVLA